MQEIWTEELAPVVVDPSEGSTQLVVETTVTGTGGRALHAEVHLVGALCAVTTPVVADHVDVLLAMGVTDLRWDLSRLRLCTSTGIDLWVDSAARVLARGGDVRLGGATGVVRRALDAVGVSDAARVERRSR